ncbi:hypothetical protein NEUTE1DRAFT_135191 [Neurospora tetrasperma FGSC 2508]|uniref:Uncharacterized protein n=1 Tax=Neurospora tetrasperma (strain FGSC 2508 / ATCC MYA-4615 / P0657) TaxID=510951 RepID=F8MC68_NEUT8|nr:uncharacterized protein NEUTE1DRAFT_135191 [Neurospora tetrasperma FGSC 2508]EGO61223.1 hypothetical protein NEUTE1DRAFT_135191 [Neurospora tetrasperma FGSC 2508]EGZ74772.1 hypothetical protein NEUTE2DRAFT_163730 [Neurospora tetrasperma FGSC 2509]
MSSIRTLGMDALKHIRALSTLKQNLDLRVNLRPVSCVYIMHIMKGTKGIERIDKHS